MRRWPEFVQSVSLSPDKFYKRTQEKNTSPVAGFFLGFQPTPFEQDCSGVPFRISGRWFIQPALLVFSASGFHRFCATKPVRSETTSSSGCQVPTMVLLGTRGPAFSGCPRGTRVAWETERARGTQSLTNQLRLALEPECLRNPTDHRRKKFQDGTDAPETFKLFVVSDVGRRSALLSSRRAT